MKLIETKKQTLETYTYVYELEHYPVYRSEETINIIFKDKKFEQAKFSFKGLYDREQWRLLGEIERLIQEIEERERQ